MSTAASCSGRITMRAATSGSAPMRAGGPANWTERQPGQGRKSGPPRTAEAKTCPPAWESFVLCSSQTPTQEPYMAEFLYLYRGTDPVVAALSPQQMQDYMQRFQGWITSLTQAGKISSCGPLGDGSRTIAGAKA